MEIKLKQCPCGEIPKELIIDNDADYNFYYARSDCCSDWSVIFYPNGYTHNEIYESAKIAWNKSKRKGE